MLTLWCHYTKIFVVCHTRFILLHGQNHGQATHDDDGGGCSVHGTREAVPCAVRVLQVAAVTSMAHPKFLELENSRFSADFSFRKKEDFEKSAFQQRICAHRFYCNFSFQTDADKAPCIIIGSNFLRVNVVFACVK